MTQDRGEPQAIDDAYLWLEDVTAQEALEWAQAQSEQTRDELCGSRFEQLAAEAIEVMQADTRIPTVIRRGDYLYGGWSDAEHTRGLWRRTTLEQYRTDTPKWDVLLDLDALAAAEDEDWVSATNGVLEPECTRALIGLSRAGPMPL